MVSGCSSANWTPAASINSIENVASEFDPGCSSAELDSGEGHRSNGELASGCSSSELDSGDYKCFNDWLMFESAIEVHGDINAVRS